MTPDECTRPRDAVDKSKGDISDGMADVFGKSESFKAKSPNERKRKRKGEDRKKGKDEKVR